MAYKNVRLGHRQHGAQAHLTLQQTVNIGKMLGQSFSLVAQR